MQGVRDLGGWRRSDLARVRPRVPEVDVLDFQRVVRGLRQRRLERQFEFYPRVRRNDTLVGHYVLRPVVPRHRGLVHCILTKKLFSSLKNARCIMIITCARTARDYKIVAATHVVMPYTHHDLPRRAKNRTL